MKENIFIYGEEWEYYTKKDAKYGIAYQVLENIFQSLIDLNIDDVDNEPNIHVPSIGCINDMCMDKVDVYAEVANSRDLRLLSGSSSRETNIRLCPGTH